MFLSIIIFAIALSLDGFGVGISYGLRKIKIPFKSLMIICISSASAIALSMFAGKLIASVVTPYVAEIIGGIALILVGIWLLLQAWSDRLKPKDADRSDKKEDPYQVFEISIPRLGLIVNVMKEPMRADLDSSGVISVNESILLGFALAMDALGAGLGAAMTGYNPFLTPLVVGVVKFLLVSLGLYIGKNHLFKNLQKRLELVPGLIIVFLGLIKLL